MLIPIYNISAALAASETVDLGSLGSHKVEHFFGMLKSRIRNFATAEAFMQCARKTLLAHLISHDIGIVAPVTQRRSDSGVAVSQEDEILAPISLGTAIATGRFIFQMALPEVDLPNIIPGYPSFVNSLEELLATFKFSKEKSSRSHRSFVSTVTEGVVSVRNTEMFQNLKEHFQIQQILEPEQMSSEKI